MADSKHARADAEAPHPTAPRAGIGALAGVVPELRLMAGLVTAATVVAALYFGREILIPLALALLLGFVLDPLVLRLKRWGLSHTPAVILVVTLALALVGLGGLLLGNQVSALSAELPTYQNNIKTKLRDLRASASRPGMFDGAVKTFDTFRAEVEQAPAAPAAGEPRAAAPPQRVQIAEKPPSPFQQAISLFEMAGGPLATAGIVLVFVVLILLDRVDLRDRLLRLWGGNLHRSTDAMDEAGERISKYLTMQLVVNVTYGIPMALGLWFIGVPGALLWGAVAALMRFVPYVGPMISAVFPLALAFAVDPGWSMVLWTVGLIALLEMVSNNVIEPWLYGASTGLSAMSLMVSATFWTALWGPIGLIMSTPLTVCLLVIGRHLPRLQFLDVLLGSQPALDTPTRVYQRLLAGDVEETIELAQQEVVDANVTAFYNDVTLPVLRMATSDHANVATAEHRHRVVRGMEGLLDALEEAHPGATQSERASVVCIGGKWEVDSLAARMVAHALALQGQTVALRQAGAVTADYIADLNLDHAKVVCLSYFSEDPVQELRQFSRRLRRRWPDVQIVAGLWNVPAELTQESALQALGVDAVAASLSEVVVRIDSLSGSPLRDGFVAAERPEGDAERVAALHASGATDAQALPLFEAAAKRASDVFDVNMAMVSLLDDSTQRVHGAFGHLERPAGESGAAGAALDAELPRDASLCGHAVASGRTLVVPDIAKDLRFAGNPALKDRGLHFYAGAPMRDANGFVIGTLCLLDSEPRSLVPREVQLLESMAAELMATLTTQAAEWPAGLPAADDSGSSPSATVGQRVPVA